MQWTTIAQAVLTGILMGSIYALVAIGLTLIFGVVRIVNFAQGEFLMVGMYISFGLWHLFGLDPYLSLLITMPAMFLFGVFVYGVFFRRVIGAPDLAQIFLTVALSIVLMNLALFFFTADFRSVRTSYGDLTVNLRGVILSVPRLLAFAGALLFGLLLYLFLRGTDTGKALRAVAQDREVAMLLGINPERMYWLAVGLGSALAGGAGALLLPFFYVFPTVGVTFVLIAFVVVIFGTLGNIKGAFLAAFIVGVAESLGILFAGGDMGLIVVFMILVLVLAFKPSGLMGA